jgi:hypothetical protein
LLAGEAVTKIDWPQREGAHVSGCGRRRFGSGSDGGELRLIQLRPTVLADHGGPRAMSDNHDSTTERLIEAIGRIEHKLDALIALFGALGIWLVFNRLEDHSGVVIALIWTAVLAAIFAYFALRNRRK